jgi:hypothetical protein
MDKAISTTTLHRHQLRRWLVAVGAVVILLAADVGLRQVVQPTPRRYFNSYWRHRRGERSPDGDRHRHPGPGGDPEEPNLEYASGGSAGGWHPRGAGPAHPEAGQGAGRLGPG